MDGGSLSLTVLGSTLGLAAIVGIGASSGFGGSVHDLERSTSRFLIEIPKRVTIVTLRVVAISCRLVYDGIILLVDFAKFAKRDHKRIITKYRKDYGPLNWRNLCKFLLIFKIWDPLPYDLLIGKSPVDRRVPFKDKRHCGFVGVCLRFRMGPRPARTGTGGRQYLHGRSISVPAYLPLEKDGSLRVDLIRKTFHIEEVEALFPGRNDVYRVTKGDIISPVMLHQLTQEFNCVHVVEYVDAYCIQRREFRQWLLETKVHYLIRVACYLAVVFAIAFVAFIGSKLLYAVDSGKLWWCISYAFGIIIGWMSIAMFFEYRYRKLKKGRANIINDTYIMDIPWHTFPSRYSAYRLTNLGQSYFL